MIQPIIDFISDLLGCDELTGDELIACKAKAKKYATWVLLVIIIAIIILVAPYIYKIVKKK